MSQDEGAEEKIKQQFVDVKTQYKKLQQLRSQVQQLEKQCSKTVATARQALKDEQDAFRSAEKITEWRSMSDALHVMASTFPQSPTFILKMIIGDINVTLNNSESRLSYKQGYEKFKMVNTSIILIFSVMALIFHESVLPCAMVHLASVWYYSSVTLRELVLKTNGSRIQWWWLVHHYCSIFIAVILLTWPPGPCYRLFKPQFMFFSLVLSCVMVLQFRYQRAKVYRQVAMGQSNIMAVSQESQVGLVFDFTFLVVCLCGIYIFQFYNSYTLLTYVLNDPECFLWQVMVLSFMFFVVGALNFVTLFSVLYSKSKKKQTTPSKKSR